MQTSFRSRGFSILLFSWCAFTAQTHAETGYEGWLRYAAIGGVSLRKNCGNTLPAAVVTLGKSEVEQSAQAELIRGVRGLLGRTERVESTLPAENTILLGTVGEIKNAVPTFHAPTELTADGFYLKTISVGGRRVLVVTARNERGVLYGTFTLLRKIALLESIAGLDEWENPDAPVRVINQWDNLNGTIERGYAGGSIFWMKGHVVPDLTRVGDYARLLASLGIDGCSINNVNADPHAIDREHIPDLARVAAA